MIIKMIKRGKKRMLKNKLLLLISFSTLILTGPTICQADACGGIENNPFVSLKCCDQVNLVGFVDTLCVVPANTYDFTIMDMGVKKSTGEIIILGKAETFDTGKANANQDVGTYIPSATLPDGDYTAVEPHVSSKITVSTTKAGISTMDGTQCTTGGLNITADVNDTTPIPLCSNIDDPSKTCRTGSTIVLKEPLNFTINSTNQTTVELAFDTRAAVLFHAFSKGGEVQLTGCVPIGPTFPIDAASLR